MIRQLRFADLEMHRSWHGGVWGWGMFPNPTLIGARHIVARRHDGVLPCISEPSLDSGGHPACHLVSRHPIPPFYTDELIGSDDPMRHLVCRRWLGDWSTWFPANLLIRLERAFPAYQGGWSHVTDLSDVIVTPSSCHAGRVYRVRDSVTGHLRGQ